MSVVSRCCVLLVTSCGWTISLKINKVYLLTVSAFPDPPPLQSVNIARQKEPGIFFTWADVIGKGPDHFERCSIKYYVQYLVCRLYDTRVLYQALPMPTSKLPSTFALFAVLNYGYMHPHTIKHLLQPYPYHWCLSCEEIYPVHSHCLCVPEQGSLLH